MKRGMLSLFLLPLAGLAQIDQQRAAEAFHQAKTLCEREGGKLWKISLCGPIVIADPATRTIATNQPAPDAPRPAVLGFTNSATEWGGTRWTTISWPLLVSLQHVQGMLLMHELFHRIQPQLGLLVNDSASDHLDTPEGRYWMQLEWKALSRAFGTQGQTRSAAVGDALAFRAAAGAGSPARRKASGDMKSMKVLRNTRRLWWPPGPGPRRYEVPSNNSQALPPKSRLFGNSPIRQALHMASCWTNTLRVGPTVSSRATI